MRHEVIHLRKRRRQEHARVVAFPSRGDEVSQETEDAESAGFADSIGLDSGRVAALISKSLARLEPRERLLLHLRFREGLPYRRLAEVFEWKDTNAAAYEVGKTLRKLDLVNRCRKRFNWGEPEREVLLAALRRWLAIEPDEAEKQGRSS